MQECENESMLLCLNATHGKFNKPQLQWQIYSENHKIKLKVTDSIIHLSHLQIVWLIMQHSHIYTHYKTRKNLHNHEITIITYLKKSLNSLRHLILSFSRFVKLFPWLQKINLTWESIKKSNQLHELPWHFINHRSNPWSPYLD